jgi:hypothetical protein
MRWFTCLSNSWHKASSARTRRRSSERCRRGRLSLEFLESRFSPSATSATGTLAADPNSLQSSGSLVGLYADLSTTPLTEYLVRDDPQTGFISAVAPIPGIIGISLGVVDSLHHRYFFGTAEALGERLVVVDTQSGRPVASPLLSHPVFGVQYDSAANRLVGLENVGTGLNPSLELVTVDPLTGLTSLVGSVPDALALVSSALDVTHHRYFAEVVTRTDLLMLAVDTQSAQLLNSFHLPADLSELQYDSSNDTLLGLARDLSGLGPLNHLTTMDPLTGGIAQLAPPVPFSGWYNDNVTLDAAAHRLFVVGQDAAGPHSSPYLFTLDTRSGQVLAQVPQVSLVAGLRFETGSAPDFVMRAATMQTAHRLTYTYEIAGASVSQPFTIGVYRSADAAFDPDVDVRVASASLSGTDGALGMHEKYLDLPEGLPPDPAHPFVLVVANSDGSIQEGGAGSDNNVASFRKYTIGLVTHGFDLLGNFPSWVSQMSQSLVDKAGYDYSLAFNWADASNDPVSGRTIQAGRDVANQLIQIVETYFAGPAFSNDVVDVHFIGHSRGAVVISQALNVIDEMGEAGTLPGQMRAGYFKMTMLDPHPAHNRHADGTLTTWASVSPMLLGWLSNLAYQRFQYTALDPEVTVPGNVSAAEVFAQHTPWQQNTNPVERVLNLWGEVPVPGAVLQDVTRLGVGHQEVVDWYQDHVIPSLASAGLLSGKADSASLAPVSGDIGRPDQAMGVPGTPTSDLDMLYPGFVDQLGLARALVQELAAAKAAYERGNRMATIGILQAFVHHVEAQRGQHITPAGADFLTGTARMVVADLVSGTSGAGTASDGESLAVDFQGRGGLLALRLVDSRNVPPLAGALDHQEFTSGRVSADVQMTLPTRALKRSSRLSAIGWTRQAAPFYSFEPWDGILNG